MNKEDLAQVQEEATSSATSPKKTFTYKFLMLSYRIVMWWTALAGFGLLAQVVLIAGQSAWNLTTVSIPGLGGLLTVSGAVATALVGGEKAAEAVKNRAK